MEADSPSDDVIVSNFSDRVGLVVFACVVGAIAYWMFWIVENFLDGRTWGDTVVRLVLHDLIFTIGLFALALIVHAFFPQPTARFVQFAIEKLGIMLTLVLGVFFAGVLFVAFVVPFLM